MKKLIKIAGLCLALGSGAVLINSCASKKVVAEQAPKNPFVPTNTIKSEIIKGGNEALMAARFVGEAAYISGDTLHVRVSFSGGCGSNNFYLQSSAADSSSITYKLYRSSDDWCNKPQQEDHYYLLPADEVNGKKVNLIAKDKKLL